VTYFLFRLKLTLRCPDADPHHDIGRG
jgi:hypothetical protein